MSLLHHLSAQAHRLSARVRGSQDALLFLLRPADGTVQDRPDLSFRAATSSDADAFARDIGSDSADRFRSRLTDRTRCFIVEGDGKILHNSWVTSEESWVEEIDSFLTPPTDTAYIYQSFTRADARGRGLFPFALSNILVTLRRDGFSRALIGVEESNTASRRSIGKAGFEPAFAISFRRRGGRLTVSPPVGPQAEMGASCIRGRNVREK